MGGITKQKSENQEFLNCEFEFECPMNWFDLTATNDSEVKYCGNCNNDVHLCLTQEDLDTHTEQRHCIAYFKDIDLSTRLRLQNEVFEALSPSNRPIILTGYPAPAKRISERLKKDDG
jgi:hypothetical protein